MQKVATGAARRERRSTAEIGRDSVFQIVSVLQSHSGSATLRDLISELGVSRLTLLKRLHKMENDRLIYRTTSAKSTRGRPEVLYHISDKPVQTITNPGGAFFITDVGKGENRYSLLERTLDFRRINESIVELDERILASSITDKLGTLKVASRKRDTGGKLAKVTDEELEKWAPWVAIVSALASQHDEFLGEAEYVAIGRKELKGLVVPFSKLGLIVNIIVEKAADAPTISQRVSDLVNRLASA